MRLPPALLPLLAVLGAIVAPALAATPPAASGCGDNGPTKSATKPTVTVPDKLALRHTGRARIVLSNANQTAAATVKLVQAGGRRVGGTEPGTYTCTHESPPATSLVAVPVSEYGRRLVRRHGRLRVTVTFDLINGPGVTNRVRGVAVIRPE